MHRVQVAASKLAEHLSSQCEHRFVPCVRTEDGCPFKVRKHMQQDHDDTLCPLADAACAKGCGRIMLRQDLPLHEAKECVNRIVPCGRVRSNRGGVCSVCSVCGGAVAGLNLHFASLLWILRWVCGVT